MDANGAEPFYLADLMEDLSSSGRLLADSYDDDDDDIDEIKSIPRLMNNDPIVAITIM